MSTQIDRIKVLSAGICSLILVLGIARFAYTPMLPLMQQQAGLEHPAAEMPANGIQRLGLMVSAPAHWWRIDIDVLPVRVDLLAQLAR